MKKLFNYTLLLSISTSAWALDLKALGNVDFSKSVQEAENAKHFKAAQKEDDLALANESRAGARARKAQLRRQNSMNQGTYGSPLKFDAESQSWGN